MVALVTRAAIDRAGLSRLDLRNALRCCMTRVRRGMYVIRSECADGTHERIRMITHSAMMHDASDIDASGLRGHTARLKIVIDSYTGSLPEDAAFSHLSAALIWGLPITQSVQSRAEAIRPSRSCEYRQLTLRKRPLPAADVTMINGAATTTPRRTLVDVAHDYPLVISVPMIDHAVRIGLLRPQDIDDILGDITSRPGARRARAAFGLSDAIRESPAESICAVRFHELDITGFVPQVEFGTPEDGFIARVDFLHRDARVIVEVNGEIKYTDGDAGAQRASRERRRDYKLRNLDYRVFQLTWSDLFSTRAFGEITRAIDARSGRTQRR